MSCWGTWRHLWCPISWARMASVSSCECFSIRVSKRAMKACFARRSPLRKALALLESGGSHPDWLDDGNFKRAVRARSASRRASAGLEFEKQGHQRGESQAALTTLNPRTMSQVLVEHGMHLSLEEPQDQRQQEARRSGR